MLAPRAMADPGEGHGTAAVAVTATTGRSAGWPPAVLGAWALWLLGTASFGATVWLEELLRRAGRPDLVSGLTEDIAVPVLLASFSAGTVGAVLAARRPRHPVGWLLLGLGVSMIVVAGVDSYARYALLAGAGPLPADRAAALVADTGWILWPACIALVLLLTPTGSPPSPRWRWWVWLTAAAPLVYVATEALLPWALAPPFQSVTSPLDVPALADGPVAATLRALGSVALILVQLAVLAAAGSLVVRFRRARGVERLQLRWVALAAALSGVAAAAVVAGTLTGTEAVWLWASAAYLMVLPLAVAAAILRYRLYDLDRIVSRTLAWAALTVLLGLGYAAVVLGLGRLLPQGSSLAVAAATLAVAALFQPLRRRVQLAVDRRFNRRRYDAARTIAAFGARLRRQVDLDTLSAELLAVTDQTMQPTSMSLWLRPR
jgi:hypothetical protein